MGTGIYGGFGNTEGVVENNTREKAKLIAELKKKWGKIYRARYCVYYER